MKERTVDQFLAHITDQFWFDVEAESKEIARAAFRVMAQHISAGEIDDVQAALPLEIARLFP